jgi:hypothetical protein
LFLESPFVSNEEEWLIENKSEGGFGAVVSRKDAPWLTLGSLIGLRREEGSAFGAGIVRRIANDENNNRCLGIEMLAPGGTAVTISPVSMSAADRNAISEDGEVCVLMAAGAANTGEVTLMMRTGVFSDQQGVLMEAYNHRYTLEPLRLIDRGADFDLARFRIREQYRRAA